MVLELFAISPLDKTLFIPKRRLSREIYRQLYHEIFCSRNIYKIYSPVTENHIFVVNRYPSDAWQVQIAASLPQGQYLVDTKHSIPYPWKKIQVENDTWMHLNGVFRLENMEIWLGRLQCKQHTKTSKFEAWPIPSFYKNDLSTTQSSSHIRS